MRNPLPPASALAAAHDDWYARPSGLRTAARLAATLQPLLRPGGRLLLIGAPLPLLTRLEVARLERVAAIGPAGSRARAGWPRRRASAVAVADTCRLPFHEAVFDQAVLADGVDGADAAAVLREMWRVLAPAGELILLTPSRAVVGPGRRTLAGQLETAMFEVTATVRLGVPLPPGRTWRARLVPFGAMLVVRAAKRDGLAPIGGRPRRAVARAQAAT